MLEGPQSPQNQEPTTPELTFKEKVLFPHVDAITEALEKAARESGQEIMPETKEAVSEILYAFLEQRINDTHLYQSEKFKVSFPWARTNIAELAKELYGRYQSTESGEASKTLPSESGVKKEFVFGTFFNSQGGNQFVFLEEVMHQVMKELPAAFEALSTGAEPENYEIYSVGSPTNKLGTMSDEFVDSLKATDAVDKFGEVYAEFVESELRSGKGDPENTSLYLYGTSMGGAFSSRVARHLIDEKAVTQSHAEHLPFLTVRIDTAPASSGLSTSRRKLQLKPGFALESAYTLATNPYMRKVMINDGEFVSKANALLEERGIRENMTPEQTALKKKAIGQIVTNLASGVPFPEDIKVTEVRGIYDPLSYSETDRRNIQNQKRNRPPALGKDIVKTEQTSENRSIHAVNMTHTMPFLRQNELQRIQAAATSFENLKKQSHS